MIARLYNSNITNPETPLYPLRDNRNMLVDELPSNGRKLASLNGTRYYCIILIKEVLAKYMLGPELSSLLAVYNQPADGTVNAKRKRLRQFIEIMIEV